MWGNSNVGKQHVVIYCLLFIIFISIFQKRGGVGASGKHVLWRVEEVCKWELVNAKTAQTVLETPKKTEHAQ